MAPTATAVVENMAMAASPLMRVRSLRRKMCIRDSIHDLPAYTPQTNYSLRAFLLPDGGRQRVFLEIIADGGDVYQRRYMLLGFADGLCTEETTVFDPGYSDSVYPVSYTHLDVYKRQYTIWWTTSPPRR